MKNMIRLLSALLALMLVFSCCAMGEEEALDPVLCTIAGQEILKSTVDETLQDMLYEGYVESAADYDTAIEYLTQKAVIDAKIAELGFDQFSAEEEEAFRNEAQTQWDAAINDYVSYFLAEDTDEARAQAKEDAEAYYTSQGYSIDTLIENMKWNDGYMKLQDHFVSVTEEEITAAYDEMVDYYKSYFAEDVAMYEYYKNYYGYDMLYTPEGYRGIIHILIEVDEELMDAYTTAQAALEEAAEGTAEEDAAPVTQADVDAARDAIFASRQKEIDDIYARLDAGETFQSLIELYGTDPGMTDEATLAEGYPVHEQSIVWDPVFTEGAFSEKMQQPGDVSDPVLGSYGIHILYYLKDIPGGGVEMTEEMHDTVKENVASEKFYNELVKWMDESVVYNQDAIDAAKALAIAPAESEAEEVPAE